MRDRLGIVFNAIYLLVGLYHLLLFSKRRREVYNAYFGVYCVTLAAYLFSRNSIVFEWQNLDTMFLNRAATVVLLLTGPLLLFFLNQLFWSKIGKIAYGATGFCLALVPPVIFASEEHVQAILHAHLDCCHWLTLYSLCLCRNCAGNPRAASGRKTHAVWNAGLFRGHSFRPRRRACIPLGHFGFKVRIFLLYIGHCRDSREPLSARP
ncbi:MAG: 7TM diverse intracellular signaling domain-containing protein [Mesorhizobium sp.]